MAPGATPLDPDEEAGLIPRISTRAELNEFEAANIEEASVWAILRAPRVAQTRVTRYDGLVELHRRMFDKVWRWAGRIRDTNKNIGVPKEQIRPAIKDFCDDVLWWIDHGTYEADEIAVRFHHRLVSIHPFPNGNGRHARLAADVLAMRLGREPFTWGGGSLTAAGASRTEYIEGLRQADEGDIARLMAFARS